jgi:mono/diheme cytochrome c family protein
VSHFAVGGGLYLVLTERRARRDGDGPLLDYVRRLSRFFILLTLVFGAISGVGIWFTIGLVHPQATSALINTFVWAWAIEWAFFIAEIAAAMVYYYGWDRLSARTHQTVGWIYFVSAWLSLVIINGILTFMLTPGNWILTRGFWDGFLNPTYWPGVVARTCVAIGLAGLYAIWTAAWLPDTALKARIARDAAWRWVLPTAVALPLALVWYLAAAGRAGVPVGEILGAKSAGVFSLLGAVFGGAATTGYPIAQRAAWWVMVTAMALTALTLFLAVARTRTYGKPLAAALMLLGFAAMAGSEWVREDLRKPWVLGQYMFVNGVRLPAPDGAPQPPAAFVERFGADRFSIDAVSGTDFLKASAWIRPVPEDLLAPGDYAARTEHQGRELFRTLCSSCHTIDGYLAIRPLVGGKSPEALSGVIARLGTPVDATGAAALWNAPRLQLTTWRGRRMPPFPGTADERGMLAGYLAILGGTSPDALRPPAPASSPASAEGATAGAGRAYFEANCAACHGPDGLAPFDNKNRAPADLYEMIGRLPKINEMMPAFGGTDAERKALAAHLASLPRPAQKGGAK